MTSTTDPALPQHAPLVALRRVSPWWLRPSDTPGERDEVLLAVWQVEGGFTAARATGSATGRGFLRFDGDGCTSRSLGDRQPVVTATGATLAEAASLTATGRPAVHAPWADGLGWCTWDAFYQSVSAAGVIEGLERYRDAGLSPTTLILDDGWLDVRRVNEVEQAPGVVVNALLRGFDADAAKFPDGLAALIARCKDEFGIRHFGVWHTLMGYWCGVDPEGPLADRYTVHARGARDIGQGTLPSVADRGLVDVADVRRFYDDWHTSLKAAGVDFVKVDNGGSLPEFCEAEDEHATVAAYHAACRDSALTHFGSGGLLPCMSMVAPAAQPHEAVGAFRNSDDFFPTRPESHRQHLRDNAANALWTGGFALPDWDMFHSDHEWASFHAAGRAVSGGPVYVSDRPGASDAALLARLLDGAGRTLRFDRPAEPLHLDADRTVVTNTHARGDHHATTVGVFAVTESAATYKTPAGSFLTHAATLAAGDVTADPWELDHVVRPLDGVAVIGWADALVPPLTVIDRQGPTVTLRPPSGEPVLLVVRDGVLERVTVSPTDGRWTHELT